MNAQQDPASPAFRRAAVASRSPRISVSIIAFLAVVLCLASCPISGAQAKANASTGKCPPVTRKDATVDVLHGVSIADPYRWLEDQDSPETRAWLGAENRCTDAALKSLPGRDQIAKRLSELQKTDAFGTPFRRGDDYFYSKRTAGQDLYVICRRHGLNAADQVLIDPQGLSADHSTSVVLRDVSADGAIIAYGVRAGGKDEVTMHFLDAKTRHECRRAAAGRLFFPGHRAKRTRCLLLRSTLEGPRVMHHQMGKDAASDAEIFGKGNGRRKSSHRSYRTTHAISRSQFFTAPEDTRTDVYFKHLEGDRRCSRLSTTPKTCSTA